jgi:phosphoribosylaminoimidazole-succinocarboxamide synthase
VTVALSDISIDLPRIASGKVREMFDAGEDLLMVATDRISVFDVVLPTPISDKGAVLNGLSVFINWDKKYPGPELADDVVAGTTARYREAYERITGRSFDEYMNQAG